MRKRACSVCLTNCLRLHGTDDEEDDAETCQFCSSRGGKEEEDANACHNPSFLKKITESTMCTLKLPLSFVRSCRKRLGRLVILEGPSGEKWKVELNGSLHTLSINFREGWRKFAADHVLQVGDQLSFTLLADSHFQVEVYDESGCQKTSALDALNCPSTLLDFNLKNAEIKSQEGLDLNPALGIYELKEKESDEPNAATQSAEKVFIDLQSNGSESRIISSPGNDLEVAAIARSHCSGDEMMKNPATENGELLPAHKLANGAVISQRRPVTEMERMQALQAAHALELVNPNTLMIMTRGYVYKGFWLGLPKQFTREWMPAETKEVTLINKSGHKWPAKWIACQNGLSAGWRRFSLDHRLEEFDVCVFELVDTINHVLLVHIFRVLGAAEEDPGLYGPSTFGQSCVVRERKRPRNSLISKDQSTKATFRRGLARINKSSQNILHEIEGHNGMSTLEGGSLKKVFKRKRCFLRDSKASISSAKAKELRLVNQQESCIGIANAADRPADLFVGEEVGHRAGRGLVSGAIAYAESYEEKIAPRASRGQSDPTSSLQVMAVFRTDLLKLAKELLVQNCLTSTNPSSSVKDAAFPPVHAVSADDMHEELSNFAESSMPVREQNSPIVANEGKEKKQKQVYKVVHIYKGRTVGERHEFLADLEGYSEGRTSTILEKDEKTGYWWIPTEQFDWDVGKCFVD